MSQSANFDNRLRRLQRTHNKMYANGIVRKIGKDGLISAHPRRRMPRFPLKAFSILIVAALLYKSTLFATLGAGVYQERVDALAAGSTVEQGGAWIMQADPATVAIAGFIAPLLSAE